MKQNIESQAKSLVKQVLGKARQEALPSNPNFNLRPMTTNELSGWSGVEEPEGGMPLVGDIDIDGLEGWVMVGRDAVHVLLNTDEGPNGVYEYALRTPFTQGKAIAQQVGRAATQQDLIDLGFEVISYQEEAGDFRERHAAGDQDAINQGEQ